MPQISILNLLLKTIHSNDTSMHGSNGREISSNISKDDEDEDFLDNEPAIHGLNGREISSKDEEEDEDFSDNEPSKNGNSKHDVDNERQEVEQQQPEQMRKLFIGGLDYKTSETTLKQHFEMFGDVIDCVVMREPQSKRSRGFGFVIYANSSMVDKAQDARPHEVDGREVQSKRAISREDSGKPEAQATVKKVYLGGLSDDIEESELKEYFKDFGNIVNINIVAHKDTGKRRGFAFVEYDDYDPVDKIVLKKFHSIRDKRIEAKKAIPKVEMDARKRGDPRAAMAGAMIALSGLPVDGRGGRPRPSRSGGAGLWDNPYNTGNYPAAYSSQANYGYPPHYHSPSAHYGASNWMIHNSQGGNPYGFRGPHDNGAYGRNSYSNQAANWTADYGGFPASQGGGGGGGVGPMRLSYQHRNSGPYSGK